ncbi:hypothetical protein SAMN05421805_112103 [Saccharopolyspora antimicrobica]|uniref:Uncharacterized protein n=1 Tax=Saccharopolyspora antimicrobica TaxID=455193 RepID=A0A1I5G4Z2_9PSEU|nr:hypothetical protein [Saccharopolyspora antimicrobica]RKT83922.1 hypothetical protein ATL45_2217 [Saccharopolyspora antimicrobica]SFO31095.1 hypothetical protein SAMN05421805_112103 [Saccharopolyspora antimicrobica]
MSDALNVNGGPEAVAALLRRLSALGTAYQNGSGAVQDRIKNLMEEADTFGDDRIGRAGKKQFPNADAVFDNRKHLAEQLEILGENGMQALGAYGSVDDFFADQHRNVQA